MIITKQTNKPTKVSGPASRPERPGGRRTLAHKGRKRKSLGSFSTEIPR